MFAADCLWIRTVNWTINTFKHLNRCLFREYVIFIIYIYTKEIKYPQKTNSTTSDPAALWTVLLFRILYTYIYVLYIYTRLLVHVYTVYIMWTDKKTKQKLSERNREITKWTVVTRQRWEVVIWDANEIKSIAL